MGYRVSEVMAFTNNDYVVVRNSAGRNAFELLTAPAAGWLMLEPPSLVWNTRYGMRTGWQANWAGGGMMPALMGGGRAAGRWDGWYAAGKVRVKTTSDAAAVANRWLGRTRPGERAVGARPFPGYFTLDTTYRGRPAGMISVNAQGAVWYHGWHGGFLAARHYS